MATEPMRTDLIIQHWYDEDVDTGRPAGWGTAYFVSEHHLEDTSTQSAILAVEGLGYHALETTDDHGDRVRIARPERVYLNLYMGSQAYGGPEEGGWWYDREEPIQDKCKDVTDLTHEERINSLRQYEKEYEEGQDSMRDYYSVIAGGMYRARLEPYPAEHSPKARPHYE